MTTIEEKFIGVFQQEGQDAEIIWEFQDNRAFGNGEAIVKYKKIFMKVDTDRGDAYVKFNLDRSQNGFSNDRTLKDYLTIYDILMTIGAIEQNSRGALTLEQAAQHVIILYDVILSYLSSEEGKAEVRAVGKASADAWLQRLQSKPRLV